MGVRRKVVSILLALLAASLAATRAEASAFILVDADLGGGSVAQVACRGVIPPPGCPVRSVAGGGWWNVAGATFAPGLGVRAEWTVRGSPVGLVGRWQTAPRWVPDVPAASDLERTAAHESELGITGRIDLLGPFAASLHPRGGGSVRTWYAWESRPGGWRAEHRRDALGVTLGAALRVTLRPRFELDLEGHLEAVLWGGLPAFGGGRIEAAAVLRPRDRDAVLIRIGVFGDRRSLVIARPAPHGVHAVKVERLVVGLRVGVGFGTRIR